MVEYKSSKTMGRFSLWALLGTALVIATTMPAMAAVTFDPETGTGFVGKGDVQDAFGWNNKALQDNANLVTFTYITTDKYVVTETWATGNPDNPKSLNSHEVTVKKTVSVNGVVNGDPRQVKGQNQFTGFDLNGFIGTPDKTGDVPTPDYVEFVTYTWTDKQGDMHTTDEMPVDADGNLYTEGNNKAVLSVEKISSIGGLYVNFGGITVLIQ